MHSIIDYFARTNYKNFLFSMATVRKGKECLISDLEALPTIPESHKKIEKIITLARLGQFSDFESDFDCPLMTLEAMLKELELHAMAEKCRKGYYDHDG